MTDAPEQQHFTVYVDDNAHYMDDGYRWTAGVYKTYEAALARCQAMVDACLAESYSPGMTAAQLYERYVAFGDDPSIAPDREAPPFSAWAYARRRCEEICGPDLRPPPADSG